MKIGYISASPLLQHFGVEGATIHIQEVCCELQKLGHDVFIIAGNKLLISKDIKVYELSIPHSLCFASFRQNMHAIASLVRHKFRIKNLLSSKAKHFLNSKGSKLDVKTLSWSPIVFWSNISERINNWEYDRYFYHRACRIVEAEQPDVLYQRFGCYRFAGVNLAKHCKTPLIMEMNGSNSFPAEWRQRYSPLYVKMIQQTERRICQRADVVIVVTQPLKGYLIGLGIPQKRVFVSPNGVDVTRFFPNESSRLAVRDQYGLNGKLIVGFVGGIRPYHGVNILIDSARLIVKECPQVHFLIVGDGPPKDALEQQTRDWELTNAVTFTGSVPFREVPAYINAMDIAVAPYEKFPHLYGSPIKLCEYMAVAKPVVTTRRPLTEGIIINNRNGLVVEPGDEQQLADAILKLALNRNLRERLGMEGRNIVEKDYTWEGNASKILDIYENLFK